MWMSILLGIGIPLGIFAIIVVVVILYGIANGGLF